MLPFMGVLVVNENQVSVLQELRNTFLELFFLPILPPWETDGRYSMLSLQDKVQELSVRGERAGDNSPKPGSPSSQE